MVLLCVACDPGGTAPALDLPPRPSGAPGGAEIAREIRGLDLRSREERIYAAVSRGNVPTWLRRLRPIELTGEVDDRRHRVTFWVTPDYLAVGSDSDFLLMPVSAPTAQRIADLVGGSLPTPRMVDAIWTAADRRIDPVRLTRDEFMKTVRYIERHNRLVNAQRFLYDAPPGSFLAGHKLDVVVTPTLSTRPGQIALYGWHRSSGRPVQPLFVGSTDSLVAFSHGLRLVHRDVLVDGVRRDLWDVLSDPELAPILSADGVLAEPRYSVVRGER